VAVLSPLSLHPWRIAISPRELPAEPGACARQAVDSALLQWLQQRLPNALPWILPLSDCAEACLTQARALGIDALLLAGGGDVGAQPRREAAEGVLLAEAERNAWPVLGLCRGLQRLQVWSGGALEPVPGHVACTHSLLPGGEQINSWHRFGIRQAAPHWIALAHALDGSIEALRHARLPWLGLMWHPEREAGVPAVSEPWLHALFDRGG
jgi:putative glutamine amidotransferase